MIAIGHYQVHLLPLLSLLLIWAVVFQLLVLLCAQLTRGSLVAWSLSITGANPIYLYKPHALVRLLQFVLPLVGAAFAGFWLTGIQPTLISGLPATKNTHLAIALAETVLLGAPRYLGALHELRYPLWGEARFIDRVARGQQSIAFTPIGRAYIRDRFDTEPEEFMRIVRRRTTSVASGIGPTP
jgi:hypothetical protein